MIEAKEKEAIQLLAAGQPQEQVSEAIGVSQSTISRFAKKHQEAIQKETERLLLSLPDIIDQLSRDIKTSNELSKALADTFPSLYHARLKVINAEEEWVREGKKLSDLYATPEYQVLTAVVKRNEEAYKSKMSPFFAENSKILTKFLELSYKKQADVLKAVGILPSVTQSIFIQNLIQKNTTNILSPVVMRVLGEHIRKSLEEPEIVDVTPGREEQ